MALLEERGPCHNLPRAAEPAPLQHSEPELVRGPTPGLHLNRTGKDAHAELVVAEGDDRLSLGLFVQRLQQRAVWIVPKPLDDDVAATDAQSSVVDIALQRNCETEGKGQGGGANQHRDGGQNTAQRPRVSVARAQAEPAGQPYVFQDVNETRAA